MSQSDKSRFAWADGDIEVEDGGQTTDLAEGKFWRDLTPAEKNVPFAVIEQKMLEYETQFQAELAPIYDGIKADAVKRLEALLAAGSLAELSSFELKNSSKYSALIVNTMRQAYEYGKKGAADELKVAAPGTARETSQIFAQNAQAVVDKQMSDLLFGIKTTVLSEVRRQGFTKASTGVILTTVGEVFDAFKANQVELAGTVAVTSGLNRGRSDVFEAYKDQIATYTFSGILDTHICPVCADLDGVTMDYATYSGFRFKPPLHFHCRCIMVATLKTQKEIPAITDVPESPGGWHTPIL